MNKESLKIIPLGGLGEVGRNMTLLEWNKKVLIIDMGFSFPEENTPGVDYTIPNIDYLKKNKRDVLGLVFTHGHYDHIGGVPYIMDKVGNPPMYGSPLTIGIVKRRQEEFPLQPKLKTNEVKDGSKITLGPFKIEFFHQNHNIPDTLGMVIETPVGNIVHSSDFKFDPTPTNGPKTNFDKLNQISKRGVTLLMSDSTGAENKGHSLSEKVICENLEKVFKDTKGRIIAATFSSLINRLQDMITISEKYGRKVVVEGYGMKTNLEIARNLGHIKVKKGTIVKTEEIKNLPDNKITVLCTGAQGEERAALMRITSNEHKIIKLKKGDTVIFSSSIIPGNERAVQNLKDNMMRQKAHIIHSQMMDIHAGGHASREELKQMIDIMKPKFFMPIHGQYSMQKAHAELARQKGIPEKNIAVVDNGQIIRIDKENIAIDKKSMNVNPVMVDGSGIGDVGGVVLHDRLELAESGIFVLVVVIDKKTRQIKNSPDIISRGFIYLRESQDLLQETRKKINQIVSNSAKTKNSKDLKAELKSKIEKLLFNKTKRRPIVLPVVIEL